MVKFLVLLFISSLFLFVNVLHSKLVQFHSTILFLIYIILPSKFTNDTRFTLSYLKQFYSNSRVLDQLLVHVYFVEKIERVSCDLTPLPIWSLL